jgi:hypothetical protein
VAKKKDSATRRFIRSIFGSKKAPEKAPPSMNASSVIRPEQSVPEHGKRAPRSTTRTHRRQLGPGFHELPEGVIHVILNHDLFDGTPSDEAVVRDPVTRRLSRKKLTDGMKRTTGFYDKSGRLLDERNADW